LASVVGAQGLSGAVTVKAFTISPESLARYGVLHSNDGRTFTVTFGNAFLNAPKNSLFVDSFSACSWKFALWMLWRLPWSCVGSSFRRG